MTHGCIAPKCLEERSSSGNRLTAPHPKSDVADRKPGARNLPSERIVLYDGNWAGCQLSAKGDVDAESRRSESDPQLLNFERALYNRVANHPISLSLRRVQNAPIEAILECPTRAQRNTIHGIFGDSNTESCFLRKYRVDSRE